MLYCRLYILAAVLSVGSCATSPADEGTLTSSAAASESSASASAPPIAAGTALPAGYKVDPSRTIIFGTNEAWTGRLSYSTASSADEVFDFLHKEMPNFGWSEITAMRSDPSVFTFNSASTGRTATITIARSVALKNTKVDMVVAISNAGAKP